MNLSRREVYLIILPLMLMITVYLLMYNFTKGSYALEEEDEGYKVSFIKHKHSTIDIYYTDDYTTPSETAVSSTISRKIETEGDDGTTSDMVVNFRVVVDEGYEVTDVNIVNGNNENIKKVVVDELSNVYRITKIDSDLEVQVTTRKINDGLVINGDDDKLLIVINNNHELTYNKLVNNITMTYEEIKVTDASGMEINNQDDVIGTGYKVIIDDKTYTVILYGDVDSNGIVNMEDANKLAKYIIDQDEISDEYLLAGDINNNETIKMNDVMKIVIND